MTDEDKKRNENFERALLFLAVLMGMTYKSYDELKQVPEDMNRVIAELHTNPKLLKMTQIDDEVSDAKIEKESVETYKSNYQQVDSGYNNLMLVITKGDGKVCDACAKWNGKVICIDGRNGKYPTLREYMSSGAFHPGCRCALEPVRQVKNEEPTVGLVF